MKCGYNKLKGAYVAEASPEEIEKGKKLTAQMEAEEAHRPYTESEVVDMILPTIINNADMDDATALRCKRYHPTFTQLCKRKMKKAPKGFRFTHEGQLYKTAGASTDFVAHYAPGPGLESMYTRIDEVHSGTLYDPIPYDGNMELLEGLHYIQDGVVYYCTRPTLAPVFDRLDKLATVQGGAYVKAV